MASLDLVVLTILGLSVARGLWRGLVREAFSLGALAAASFVVWRFEGPAAAALSGFAGDALPALAARSLAVVGLAVATFAGVAALQRVARRSVAAAGLGLLDRLAGGAVGALEGGLLVALAIAGTQALLGADHALLSRSRSAAVVARVWTQITPPDAKPGDVAAPAPPAGG